MKLEATETVDVPITDAFDHLCRFDSFERAAVRRGMDVRRKDENKLNGLGAAWAVCVEMAGKPRDVDLVVSQCDRPEKLCIDMSANNIEGTMTCALSFLEPDKTQMDVSVELTPRTLPARLLLRSLSLTQKKLDKKFRNRVADFAAGIEKSCAGRG